MASIGQSRFGRPGISFSPSVAADDTQQSADEYARTHNLKTLNGLRPAFRDKTPAQIKAIFNDVGLNYHDDTGEVTTIKGNRPVDVSIFAKT